MWIRQRRDMQAAMTDGGHHFQPAEIGTVDIPQLGAAFLLTLCCYALLCCDVVGIKNPSPTQPGW